MPPTRHRYRCIRQIAGDGRSETRGEAPQGQIGHSSDNQRYRGPETRAQRDERDPPRDVLALQRAPTWAIGGAMAASLSRALPAPQAWPQLAQVGIMKLLLCFARTGVNTPVTMSPNARCRKVQLPRRGLLGQLR